jgi:hypothetical protein
LCVSAPSLVMDQSLTTESGLLRPALLNPERQQREREARNGQAVGAEGRDEGLGLPRLDPAQLRPVCMEVL